LFRNVSTALRRHQTYLVVAQVSPGCFYPFRCLTDVASVVDFKWVLGEIIGHGNFGSVHLGLNASTGELIAIKQVELLETVSHEANTRQLRWVKALKTEWVTLQRFDHPHIVQFYGYEETAAMLRM
jgi:serine/threonine protein kinase